MRVHSKAALVSFYTGIKRADERASAKEAFDVWFARTERAEWANFAEVKATFPQTDIKTVEQVLPDGKTKRQVTFLIFDVRGNHYRIVCAVHFNTGKLFVRYAGDHEGYDKLDLTKL